MKITIAIIMLGYLIVISDSTFYHRKWHKHFFKIFDSFLDFGGKSQHHDHHHHDDHYHHDHHHYFDHHHEHGHGCYHDYHYNKQNKHPPVIILDGPDEHEFSHLSFGPQPFDNFVDPHVWN